MMDKQCLLIKLNKILNKIAGELSHGQKQWLEIGMLLAQDPSLLLVDEPAAGMTNSERTDTATLLKELSKTHKCNLFVQSNKPKPVSYYKHPAGNVYISDRMLDIFIPLLKKQDFLHKVEKYKSQKIDINLNIFRELPVNIIFDQARWFFHVTGVQVDLTEKYLNITDHETIKNKIIIHRSFRYRNYFINYNFLNSYKNLLFIGTKNEYEDLKKEIKNLEFYDCKDFLDMAKIIKSSKFFIGNSSIGYNLAEGLKVPRLLEACPNFPVVRPHGKNAYDFYYQIHFEKFFKILNESTN